MFSPDFDSTLCSNSTCNKSPIRLLKGINKSTLICNKISKLLKRYLRFKLPIRTQLEVFVQEMHCGEGGDRGVEAIGMGGVREAGDERMGGLAGEPNKDLYHLILGVATNTCSTLLTCNHCVKFKLHSLFL